jgi:hypothetical protein
MRPEHRNVDRRHSIGRDRWATQASTLTTKQTSRLMLASAGAMDADLALGVAMVLAIVVFALPILIRHAQRPQTTGDFLAAPVETANGPLPGASAWLQVLLIPATLALAPH